MTSRPAPAPPPESGPPGAVTETSGEGSGEERTAGGGAVGERAADETADLLDRFLAGLRRRIPRLRALWAHGSLAGGDYQQGRSDLDLIAIADRPCTPDEERQLGALHATLDRTDPLAAKLHCSYLAADETADPARIHLTWAHRELMRRTVTPVTRRELHTFGRVLHGDTPAALLPPVTDAQLAAFIRADLRDYWRPALEDPELWLQDIWVDLGLLTLARATVTLRDGTLISKGEALAVLGELGAPDEVIADIRNRRYGPAAPPPPPGPSDALARRADLTRAFLGPALDRTLATYGHNSPDALG
ncbi:nucleotidyltransferase [Streptomyces platensis]|uniref:nucleotidyltransferase domain-containing protein n=1 Tax=Streptomyces platensis TaxID=58346 RepID=UPI0038683846|nr:nucleotidyltransferase domain-containing protein [Streptomyces platensis]